MADNNPFPESEQKAHLRRLHLQYLAEFKRQIGRGLNYLGLPSAEMYDVKLWQPVLKHITAIEIVNDIALDMYRTAQRLGVRPDTIIIENSLAETARLLAMEEHDAKLSLAQMSLPEQEKIRKVRSLNQDVINLDLCGGFLYPDSHGESGNVKLLQNLIKFQSRHKNPFTIILTFNLRDTGGKDYDKFIKEVLSRFDNKNPTVSKLKQFYTAKEIKNQPLNLRRLRFCVPTYLHKLAYDFFQVRSRGAWYYKTFYHTALVCEPRQSRGVLGTWPPIDEVNELIRTPLTKVDYKNENIVLTDLPAPSIP